MKEKIEANRQWSFYDVRDACIRNNLYTIGDNADYEKLAYFIKNKKPTYKNIYLVAKDIYMHSINQRVINIMFIIENECVKTTFLINGSDDI